MQPINDTAKQRVLIVEDEPYIVESLRFLLTREGWIIDFIDNGRLALQSIERLKPAVVILDIMIPGLDGFEVLQAIRRNPATARQKVMILTAKGQAKDRQRMRDLGADAFCTKPYSNKDLVETVRRLVDQAAEA